MAPSGLRGLLVTLTSTVAVTLYLAHLRRKFKRSACAAARVALKEWRRVRSGPFVVTWFAHRPPSDADGLRALLDGDVTLKVVTSGAREDVDPETRVLVSPDAAPYEREPGLLEAFPNLEAWLLPYAGLHPAMARALRRERRRRNARNDPALVACNAHHNAPMTAELAVALALAAAKRICAADAALRRGDWRPRGLPLPPPGAPGPLEQLTLDGRRALVVGFGAVGRRVALALAGLGMDVAATARSRASAGPEIVTSGSASATVDVRPAAALNDLLPATALLVLCCPLSEGTRGLIDAAALALLPEDAVVVNAARGEVVDEAAVHAALRTCAIGAFASDVWYAYPKTYAAAAATPPWSSDATDFSALPRDRTCLSPHRGGAVGLADAERRRSLVLAAALNAVARTGDARALATVDGIAALDVDAGY